MDTSPTRIERGMSRQLTQWRATVARRQQRLGWKIGFNLPDDQQRLGLPSAMVGFLSTERQLAPGSRYQAPDTATLLVEPEVALLIGNDVPANASAAQALAAIAGYTAALELVDTTRSVNDDIEEILAGNMFHQAVLLGETRLAAAGYKREQLSLSLRLNSEELRTLEAARVPQDFATLITTVADILATHGEQLQQGDWIITGAAARPVAVKAGDHIELEMGELGAVTLSID